MKNNKFTKIIKINQNDAEKFGLKKDITKKLFIDDNKVIDVFWFDECLFTRNTPVQNMKTCIQSDPSLNNEKLLKFTKPTSNKLTNFKRIITSTTLKNNNL